MNHHHCNKRLQKNNAMNFRTIPHDAIHNFDTWQVKGNTTDRMLMFITLSKSSRDVFSMVPLPTMPALFTCNIDKQLRLVAGVNNQHRSYVKRQSEKCNLKESSHALSNTQDIPKECLNFITTYC